MDRVAGLGVCRGAGGAVVGEEICAEEEGSGGGEEGEVGVSVDWGGVGCEGGIGWVVGVRSEGAVHQSWGVSVVVLFTAVYYFATCQEERGEYIRGLLGCDCGEACQTLVMWWPCCATNAKFRPLEDYSVESFRKFDIGTLSLSKLGSFRHLLHTRSWSVGHRVRGRQSFLGGVTVEALAS